MTGARPLVFLVAGEPSGDLLGGRLMDALHAATGGEIRFAGVGGETMGARGLRSLFAIDDLAVMGFAEVLPRLFTILRRMREVERAVAAARPDVVVTIDAPGFNLRLARRLRSTGVPLVQYVAPQLWAWRPGRARRLAGVFDRILALFPFEPSFFAALGVEAVAVGHPAVEAPPPDARDLRQRLGIASAAPVLLMLPGSRGGLVRRMLPVYRDVAARLAAQIPGLAVLLPVVPATRAVVRAAVADWPGTVRVVEAPEDRRSALALASAAIAVSGTSTLELGLAGVPMAVAYRTSALSAALARRLIRVKHVALPNLVLQRPVVPELLQEDCTAEALARIAGDLLAGGETARRQRRDLAGMREMLGITGVPPSARAAREVLDVMARSAGRRSLPGAAPGGA